MVSHSLDFLDFLFGPIESVRALAGNQAGAYRPEDVVTASYRFASGGYGSGAFCYAADRDEEWDEIVGAARRVRVSTQRALPIRAERREAVGESPVADPSH